MSSVRKYDNDDRPWHEIVKDCSFCRRSPTFVQMGSKVGMGNKLVGIVCRPCGQQTGKCKNRDNAIHAWNRKKR